MKRTEGLIPLSHDHHEALLVALRLRKGGPASLRDSWPQDLPGQREALLLFADRSLAPHFQIEEDILFPPCSSAHGELLRLAEELGAEHRSMRQLLNDIRTGDPASLPAKMMEFGILLESHIRKEERSFFPLLEEAIEAKNVAVDLGKLATQYAAYHSPPACNT